MQNGLLLLLQVDALVQIDLLLIQVDAVIDFRMQDGVRFGAGVLWVLVGFGLGFVFQWL